MGKWFAMIIVGAIGTLGGLFISLLFALALAWPVEIIWNDFMVNVLGTKTVTYWQAFELLVLCSVLFNSTSDEHTSSKKD